MEPPDSWEEMSERWCQGTKATSWASEEAKAGERAPHKAWSGCTKLVTLAGGPVRDGHRSPKSKRMEGRLWNFSKLMLKAVPFLGCVSGWWGALGSSGTLWARREEVLPLAQKVEP